MDGPLLFTSGGQHVPDQCTLGYERNQVYQEPTRKQEVQ